LELYTNTIFRSIRP